MPMVYLYMVIKDDRNAYLKHFWIENHQTIKIIYLWLYSWSLEYKNIFHCIIFVLAKILVSQLF